MIGRYIPARVHVLLLSAGVLYLALTAASPHILRSWLGIPQLVTYTDLRRVVITYQVASFTIAAVPLTMVLASALTLPPKALRAALGGMTFKSGSALVIGLAAVSIALDWLNLWPFSWRAGQNTTPVHVASLLGHRDWVVLSLFVFTSAILIPILEEITFRFALLRVAVNATGSRHVGVLVSASAFALLHLSFIPNPNNFLNVCWLFLFSMILGYVTLRVESVSIAIVSHMARNSIEVASLVLFISQRI